MKKAATIGLLVIGACTQSPPELTGSERARQVADNYLEANSIKPLRGQVSVKDEGKTWTVSYAAPEGYVGGPRLVEVDKRTMKVTGTVAWQ